MASLRSLLGPRCPTSWGLAAAVAAGCSGESVTAPDPITGRWEVHQIELSSGVVSVQEALAATYPSCPWGRMTWEFEPPGGTAEAPTPAYVSATTDVLCPVGTQATPQDFTGCSVTARVAASWDAAAGKWIVADGVVARSRTLPDRRSQLPGTTTCEARIDPGEYLAVRVRGETWSWEMLTPGGVVARLKSPDTLRPDFVAGLIEVQASAPPPGGP